MSCTGYPERERVSGGCWLWRRSGGSGARLVKGKSIKEIVRELKVSRNTVRKVLRSGAICFEYAREVQPLPKLGPWRADLDEC